MISQFAHGSLAKLVELLGVNRKIPMQEGSTMYMYTTSGTLENGTVAEGEVIPLSKYQRDTPPVGEITLQKWRKATSAEAIMKSGYQEAVRETDAKLIRDVQKTIRQSFFNLINGAIIGETSVAEASLQAVLAASWGQLQVKFEDDAAEPVHFVNPLDIADYLKAANISVQTAFGMNYVQDFLGLGTVSFPCHFFSTGSTSESSEVSSMMGYINTDAFYTYFLLTVIQVPPRR